MLRYLVFFVFFFAEVLGVSMGNPASPELPERGLFIPRDSLFGLKVGYEIDYGRDKRFKFVEEPTPNLDGSIRRFAYTTQQGVVTLNINNFVEGYFGLGVTDICLNRKVQRFHLDYDGKNKFIGQVGGRAMIIFWGETTLGIDAKYFRALSISFDSVKRNGASVSAPGAKLDYDGWQAGLGLSHQFRFFVPYVGGIYTIYRLKLVKTLNLPELQPAPKIEEFQNRGHFSLVLGTCFSFNRSFLFTVEGRIFSEKGISGNVDLRF